MSERPVIMTIHEPKFHPIFDAISKACDLSGGMIKEKLLEQLTISLELINSPAVIYNAGTADQDEPAGRG